MRGELVLFVSTLAHHYFGIYCALVLLVVRTRDVEETLMCRKTPKIIGLVLHAVCAIMDANKPASQTGTCAQICCVHAQIVIPRTFRCVRL